jgi:hypothetical protein
MTAGSFFYAEVLARLPVRPAWVVQVRGGPDIALNRLHDDTRARITAVLSACDAVIADNPQNYAYAVELGASPEKAFPYGFVPGTGGLDLSAMRSTAQGPPSARDRVVLWPKAYEGAQSKALPVLRALELAWPALQPCRVVGTGSDAEVRLWSRTLSREVRDGITLEPRVPRADLLERMGGARVMLAPSLTDGVPNSLYEAMALGALPVMSPLETITPLVREPDNVLFAHNLHPEEIAAQLVRAMTDDKLVDRAASANAQLVGRYADRRVIGPHVRALYEDLAR